MISSTDKFEPMTMDEKRSLYVFDAIQRLELVFSDFLASEGIHENVKLSVIHRLSLLQSLHQLQDNLNGENESEV